MTTDNPFGGMRWGRRTRQGVLRQERRLNGQAAVAHSHPAWPVPTPLGHRAERSQFPIHAFPDWIRAFVEAEAEATQTPLDMASMFVLAALATAAGGRVRVEPVPGWTEGVNLFIAVAMEPGSRKSAVHRDVFAPLLDYERLLLDQSKPDIAELASIRRIAEAVARKTEKAAANATDPTKKSALDEEVRTAAAALERIDVPVPPRLITSDATPEALATLPPRKQRPDGGPLCRGRRVRHDDRALLVRRPEPGRLP